MATPTPAPSTRTPAATHSSNSGSSISPATPGPEDVPTAHTPIREGPTPPPSWSASSASTPEAYPCTDRPGTAPVSREPSRVAGGHYGVVMERPIDRSALDLDQADGEIQGRWFVWTAAGLTVHPVTWADHDAGRPAALVGRSDVTTPRSLGLRVSRPNAHADI